MRFGVWQAIERLILFTLLLLPPGARHSQAQAEAGYALQVLEMDETGVVLELRLAGFSVQGRPHDGVVYQTVVVPGADAQPGLLSLSGPGQPQLPGLTPLLGTPAGGIARIDILEAESETLDGIHLFPQPALTWPDADGPPVELFAPDAVLYGQDAYWPAAPAEPGLSGWLRDQPVAQVRLIPFQYNPAQRRLRVYRRLRVSVRFSPGPASEASGQATSPDTPYEQVLAQVLLNYAALPAVPPTQGSRDAASCVSTDVQRPCACRDATSCVSTPQGVGPALKILVEADGLYRMTYADLQTAGFDLSGLDPRRLRLTNRGDQVAIAVQGEADGAFDPGDWLEFYGLAPLSAFTRRNVYWLAVGDGPGVRMAEVDGEPDGAGATPTAFYHTLHLEENHVYWSLLPDGEGQDHWFWERFPSAPYAGSFTFGLHNIAAVQADGVVRVDLHGRTSVASINPDHHTQIYLNGILIDEAWWDGDVPFVHETTVSQRLFREGANTLKVKMPGDTGASVDSLYLNGFDLGYWDRYVAEGDHLIFTAPETGPATFLIGGFTDQTIEVYDISDPTQPKRLVNGAVEADGSHYRVRIAAEAAAEARYLALTTAQKRVPAGLLLDTPSNWRSPDHGADYVIITHADFAAAAARLAGYRASQGLRMVTADITDVYDEFSAGLVDPQAIRDLLAYAYQHWTPPAPLYVLLVGDANYDYRDYLVTGNENWVPTHLLESNLIGQTPTDNWFACVSGEDPLPDMAIGRLSVRTAAEANAVVDKILAYEQHPPKGDWTQRMILVADDETGFEAISEQLAAALPAGYTAQRIYPTAYSQPTDPTAEIIQAIDRGALIVNYIGHGNVTIWGSWSGRGILSVDDLAQLNNGPFYPLLVTGNCSNGLFAHPTIEYALAEVFVNMAQQGGVAAWSPTGLGYTSWHSSLAESLYQAMFGDYIYQLGPAIVAAKLAALARVGWPEAIEIFTLLGDPATSLQIVQPCLSLDKVALIDHAQAGHLLSYNLIYANIGNQAAENVVLTETYDARTVYHSASPPPTTGDRIWEIGSLLAGRSGTITVTVRVMKDVPPGVTLLNQAALCGDGLDTEVVATYTPVRSFIYLPVVRK